MSEHGQVIAEEEGGFSCGCRFKWTFDYRDRKPLSDSFGTGKGVLVSVTRTACPLHAHAEAMRDLLVRLDRLSLDECCFGGEELQAELRALLAKVEAGDRP